MVSNKTCTLYIDRGRYGDGILLRLPTMIAVVTSGPGSGWQRGRLPQRVGRALAAGHVKAYMQVGARSVKKTAILRGGRYYLRDAPDARSW